MTLWTDATFGYEWRREDNLPFYYAEAYNINVDFSLQYTIVIELWIIYLKIELPIRVVTLSPLEAFWLYQPEQEIFCYGFYRFLNFMHFIPVIKENVMDIRYSLLKRILTIKPLFTAFD